MFALALTMLLAATPEPALPPVLTLAEALRLFHERSFDLVIADAQLAAARGDERAARAIANPALS
ncbi:MAG TPA: hypothetical protein VG496_01640, partial [Myxococcales bacterium]|nr:hypothetical protein [Myxococcales bacterium]